MAHTAADVVQGDGFTMRPADVQHEPQYPYLNSLRNQMSDLTDAEYEILRNNGDVHPMPAHFVPSLTFAQLQNANIERGKVWGAGREIPSMFNTIELSGEAGELMEAVLTTAWIAAGTGKVANAMKKIARSELGIVGGTTDMTAVEEELGDVVICCSLLANKLGINLGRVVAEKFNKTSEKYGFPHRLPVAA